MGVCLDVVAFHYSCPTTDDLLKAIYQDKSSQKEFGYVFAPIEWGVIQDYQIEEMAERLAATHPNISRVLGEIARYGGLIKIS